MYTDMSFFNNFDKDSSKIQEIYFLLKNHIKVLFKGTFTLLFFHGIHIIIQNKF